MGRAVTSNPFSTARTRPGAIAYRFAEGDSLTTLVETLQTHGWRGQIVGPHGSGKSTLLAAFDAAWDRYGRQPLQFTLHDGQRQLASSFWRRRDIDAATQIMIDGYEQLSQSQRLRLRLLCRHRRCGLLVTTHRPVRLPLIHRTQVDLQTVQSIVNHLTSDRDWRVTPDTLAQLMRCCHGDVRETFFTLYDLYESQRQH
jgi:hypothetical protein